MALLFLILGLVIGSFLNVVIFRTHESEGAKAHRSVCRKCKKTLRWYDMIPVVSFFVLKGKCRDCKSLISWQYPFVELITGLLFVATYAHYWYGWLLYSPVRAEHVVLFIIRDLIFLSFLILIFVYDLKHQIIPDRFTLPAIVIALILNLILGYQITSLLYGAAILGIFFLVQYMVSRGTWIGGGDIRLGVLIGFMLGVWNALAALFFAYVIGAVFSIGLIIAKKAKMQTKIAFGTFLALATAAMLFIGDHVVEFYLSSFYL